jgi:uncharacterized membrane protein required for colicin V production
MSGFVGTYIYTEVSTLKNSMVFQVKSTPEERIARLRQGFAFANHSRIRYCRGLLFTAFVFSPAIYYGWLGDFVVAAVCAIAVIGAFSGYRAGASWILAPLAAIATAIAFAPPMGKYSELIFSQLFGTTGLTNRFLSIGILGLVLSLVVSSVLIMIARRVLRYRPRLDSFNRWLGLGFGGLLGPIAILFFLGGMLILEPTMRKRASMNRLDDERGQFVSKFVLTTTKMTRQSRLSPTVVEYNPFTRIPQLNKMEELQRTIAVLSDPAKIRGMLRHPSIKQLQQRPEVKLAMQKLTAEPVIQEILRSGKRMDRSMAMSLLRHPAVLELVDQPGFLTEASKIIRRMHLVTR